MDRNAARNVVLISRNVNAERVRGPVLGPGLVVQPGLVVTSVNTHVTHTLSRPLSVIQDHISDATLKLHHRDPRESDSGFHHFHQLV